LLPVFENKPTNYIKATWTTINRFKGIEIIFLLLPFMKKKNKTPKVLFNSLFFISVFYIFIVILSIIMFSTEQVKVMLWPGITMIKSIDIPGTFVERWEGIIMAVWVLFFFTTFTNTYYFSADILKDILHIEDIKISSLLIVPFIYIIALYPENVAEVMSVEKSLMSILFIINIVIIPIILFAISKFKLSKRKDKY
ncbi:spore germination protein, partial [Clostridium sporogenes]